MIGEERVSKIKVHPNFALSPQRKSSVISCLAASFFSQFPKNNLFSSPIYTLYTKIGAKNIDMTKQTPYNTSYINPKSHILDSTRSPIQSKPKHVFRWREVEPLVIRIFLFLLKPSVHNHGMYPWALICSFLASSVKTLIRPLRISTVSRAEILWNSEIPALRRN